MGLLRKINSLFDQQQNTSGYSVSRHEHYHNILNPKDIIDLLNRYKNLPLERLVTSEKIAFGSTGFGTSLSDFLATNQKPRYIIEKKYNRDVDHTILFYKERLGKHKAISQFHFVDEAFLVGMYLFRNFLQRLELQEVINVIFEKYKIPNTSGSKEFIITDGDNSIIQMKNDVYTSLFYLSGDKYTLDGISKRVGDYHELIRLNSDNESNGLFEKL